MLKNNFIGFVFAIVVCLCFYGCENDSDTKSLNIQFTHLVDGEEISYGMDNIFYVNESGNQYSVARVQYVLSDIILYFEDESIIVDDFIFVNTTNPNSLNKTINNLPGLCTGISFRLGFSEDKNIDNAYINAENNFHSEMLWPNLYGTNLMFQGGYHYMKLEGEYLHQETGEEVVEGIYNTHTGPINTEDFSIQYPIVTFTPSSSISINMNVNNWYNNPVYDMSFFGNSIMGNIEAQNILYENGLDVFFVETQ